MLMHDRLLKETTAFRIKEAISQEPLDGKLLVTCALRMTKFIPPALLEELLSHPVTRPRETVRSAEPKNIRRSSFGFVSSRTGSSQRLDHSHLRSNHNLKRPISASATRKPSKSSAATEADQRTEAGNQPAGAIVPQQTIGDNVSVGSSMTFVSKKNQRDRGRPSTSTGSLPTHSRTKSLPNDSGRSQSTKKVGCQESSEKVCAIASPRTKSPASVRSSGTKSLAKEEGSAGTRARTGSLSSGFGSPSGPVASTPLQSAKRAETPKSVSKAMNLPEKRAILNTTAASVIVAATDERPYDGSLMVASGAPSLVTLSSTSTLRPPVKCSSPQTTQPEDEGGEALSPRPAGRSEPSPDQSDKSFSDSDGLKNSIPRSVDTNRLFRIEERVASVDDDDLNVRIRRINNANNHNTSAGQRGHRRASSSPVLVSDILSATASPSAVIFTPPSFTAATISSLSKISKSRPSPHRRTSSTSDLPPSFATSVWSPSTPSPTSFAASASTPITITRRTNNSAVNIHHSLDGSGAMSVDGFKPLRLRDKVKLFEKALEMKTDFSEVISPNSTAGDATTSAKRSTPKSGSSEKPPSSSSHKMTSVDDSLVRPRTKRPMSSTGSLGGGSANSTSRSQEVSASPLSGNRPSIKTLIRKHTAFIQEASK